MNEFWHLDWLIAIKKGFNVDNLLEFYNLNTCHALSLFDKTGISKDISATKQSIFASNRESPKTESICESKQKN